MLKQLLICSQQLVACQGYLIKFNDSLAKTERINFLLVDLDYADELQKQAPIQIYMKPIIHEVKKGVDSYVN